MDTLFHFEGLRPRIFCKPNFQGGIRYELLEVLQRFDEQELPDINPWLKSANESVVAFALKLAKIYNQFEVKDSIMELLAHQQKNKA